jgi:hypothetical protein
MSGPAVDGTRTEGTARFAAALALAFTCVVGTVLIHHEMWRDELQAWELARNSPTFGALLANKRYEGHPDLWYVVLYWVSRLWRDPAAMQLLHLALASATVYVVGRWAPFDRLAKALLVGGFFFAYEYAVISRSYVLGALTLFALCALYPRWAERPLAVAALLALLANSSVYGLLAAGAVCTAFAVDLASRPAARARIAARRASLAGAVLLVAAAMAWSIYSMVPPVGAPFVGDATRPGPGPWVSRWRALATTGAPWRALVPEGTRVLTALWGDAPPIGTRAHLLLEAGLGAGMLAGAVLVLRRRTVPVALFASGTAAILLLSYFRFAGSARHEGHIYLLFVAALWVAGRMPDVETAGARQVPSRDGAAAPWRRRASAWFVGAVVVAQAAAGALALGRDFVAPFSTARATAEFITARGWRDRLIIASARSEATAVAGYLDRPVYSPEEGRRMTYARWDIRWPGPDRARRLLIAALDSLVTPAAPEAVVVLSYDFPRPAPGLVATEAARFDQAIDRLERYRVYLVRRAPAAGTR